MKLRLPKSAKSLATTHRGKPLVAKYFIHKHTKTLYLKGSFDDTPLLGFVYPGTKRGEIGGSVLHSDALRKSETSDVARLIATKCKFNGVKQG